jgi:CheY-like chemotaxis protein
MTGYELAGRLRALPGGGGAVILALSGGAVLEDEAVIRAPRFDGFILKPFEFGAFPDRLKDYLAKKKNPVVQENGS